MRLNLSRGKYKATKFIARATLLCFLFLGENYFLKQIRKKSCIILF